MDAKQLKSRTRIEEVIAGFVPLEGEEPNLSGPDGLQVDTGRQVYRWASQAEGGDVIAWLQARYGWAFKDCLAYLKNRLALPEELRTQPVVQNEQPKALEAVWQRRGPGQARLDRRDRRIREALQLAPELEGFFEELLEADWSKVFRLAYSTYPNLFTVIEGDLREFEACCECGCAFRGWGRAYLAGSDEAYCGDCVRRYETYSRAIDLVLGVWRSQHGHAVGAVGVAAGGGEHHSPVAPPTLSEETFP